MSNDILMLTPKKWDEFQHYKDRSPPWVKIHRELLNNKEFLRLPTASKALAPLLWLLASESKESPPVFNATTDELEFRLRMSVKDIETGRKALIHAGFFIVASTVLADCLQVAIPEREREAEKEVETKTEKDTDTPVGVSSTVWQDFKKHRKAKKAPITDTVIAGIKREADKAGWTMDNALIEICSRGWTGFNAEWVTSKQSANNNIMRGVI